MFDGVTKTEEIEVGKFSYVSVLIVVAIFIVACYFFVSANSAPLRTIVISSNNMMNLKNERSADFDKTNYIASKIVEDELEAIIVNDSKRVLVSKKEWVDGLSWRQEAERLGIDEIIHSKVFCDDAECKVRISIYTSESDSEIIKVEKVFPHKDLLVFSNLVDKFILDKLFFEKSGHYHESDDAILRAYYSYRRKVDNFILTDEIISEIEVFSEENTGFMGARLLLLDAYMSKTNDDSVSRHEWLRKAFEYVNRLDESFPYEPLVERAKYKVNLARRDIEAAEKNLERMGNISGIDVNQLILDKLNLRLEMGELEKVYSELIKSEHLRETNTYFHLKAKMELMLDYEEELLETSLRWVEVYPSFISKYYLASAYSYWGEFMAAIDLYEQLVREGFDHDVYVNLALAQFFTGDYRSSLRTLDEIARNEESTASDLLNYGEVMKALNLEEANSYFRKVIQYCESNEIQDIDLTYKALAHAHLGESEKALISLQEAAQSELYRQTLHLYSFYIHSLVGNEVAALHNGEQALKHGIRPHWLNLPWTEKYYNKLSI
ncbi:tetratricopeptide repeat protein [Marinibactrum halimedae]|uniref:Tetratricopeptide repeat protein n=1 Tax=Marinibactrum halimedae TaxID=1444977 RepID=A0AA37T2A3_9GAMM|nr:hypothetical protein [Marinibactrum halimedae]MCD9458109.1 hypothetical protein [Marinibactrum halimedae]GLS25043.1 hypothetical protein GCM10007877_07570 [Marinibactrum halimedae]